MIRKIGILSFWEFPEGMAPTNRILAYSKGLVENDVKVEIYSFRRFFGNESKNVVKRGVVNGATYRYVHLFHSLGKKFKIIRIIDELILRFKLLYYIYKSNKKDKFDCFFISFDDNHSFSAYLGILRFIDIPLVFVGDEFPIPIRDFMKSEIPEDMLVKYRYYHKFFVARILMSNSLKKFYDTKISFKPTYILNTIVDATRFNHVNSLKTEVRYICYMGNMDLRKDNVQNIIKAFSLIEKFYPDLELHLYGTPRGEDINYLHVMVSDLGLSTKVRFKGRASYADVPNILRNALILVNSQPITKRAEGGFPTKLGEYLLSGRPSIFTDSGDISFYIKDGKYAYIVPPEDSVAFSDKFLFVLENYDSAMAVANCGKSLIKENFDAKNQTLDLMKFLDREL